VSLLDSVTNWAEESWKTIKDLGKGIGEAFVSVIGCVGGTIGYGVAQARMAFDDGDTPRSLTAEETAIPRPSSLWVDMATYRWTKCR
jgi:hypothetical protein